MTYTLPKLSFFLVLGIVASIFVNFSSFSLIITGVILIALLVFAFFHSKKLWKQNIFFGIVSCAFFFFLGAATSKLHLPENQKGHYLNHISETGPELIELKIRESLKSDKYNDKYIVEIESVNESETQGSAILYYPKDSTNNSFSIDTRLLVYAYLEDIKGPLNPHQFSYKSYLENKGVIKEIKLKPEQLLKKEYSGSSLKGISSLTRTRIINRLKNNGFAGDELAIIEALFLGEKKDVSKEVYAQYADAGVIHILAVSGLHVGIILILLNFLLSPLKFMPKGKILKLICVITLLWGFAFIAGLSASILRAVTMFTFVAIGMHLNRKGHVFNAIATSLIFLLLVNPFYLFEVGFQLSYLAVISIVLLQPVISDFFKPEKKIPKTLWSIFTVTLAAQIGVLPISLFYFHQFPGLFFISNLVLLPFLGFILGFGIFVIVLALLQILPSIIGNCFEAVIYYLNYFVRWISEQESFVFKSISFSAYEVVVSYFFICSVFLFLKSFSLKRFQFVLVSVVLIQIIAIFQLKKSNAPEFIVFHRYSHSVIGVKDSKTFHIYSDDSIVENTSLIKDYLTGEMIKTEAVKKYVQLPNFYIYKNQKLLLIDSLGVYNFTALPIDYLILKDSPQINLNRAIDTLKPKFIIADGSNYPSFVQLWKKTALQRKIPFHSTGEKGAFIIKE